MYAFVHLEKTAGTTLNSILRRSFGTGHCDIRLPLGRRRAEKPDRRDVITASDLRRVKRIYRDLRGIAGHEVKVYSDLRLECPGIRFFTLLRDPVRRFRSHFLTRTCSFDARELDRWLSDSWIHNWQTKMIAGEASAEKAIELLSTRFGFVGLTERFDESLVLLGHWLQEPAFRPEYRRLNQCGENRSFQNAVRKKIDVTYLDTDAVRARIQEANTEDQKVYDFVTTALYPRQRAAFAGNLDLELRAFQQQNERTAPPAEPLASRFVRNYIYKPLLHCRVA